MSKLREARDLIADERHWTKRQYFADASGHVVSLADKPARYCAMGALLAAWGLMDLSMPLVHAHHLPIGDDQEALTAAAEALFPDHVVAGDRNTLLLVNDELGHEAVMQVYEKAIVEEYGSL